MNSTDHARSLRRAVLALLCFAAQQAWAQGAAPLEQARALIDQGDAPAAYQLLAPYESAQAGNPDFDYVFALAALDAGRVTEAVFALERVLAVEPGNAPARAELARAYLELGEVDNARREFEAVKAARPPPEVESTIDRYLAGIERLQSRDQRTQVSGYVALTLGRDTNVNAAQDERQLNIPRFEQFGLVGPFTLDATGVARADNFAQIAAGGNLAHRLGPNLALLASGAVSQRWHDTESRFDIGDGRADLGLTWQRGVDAFTVALQGDRFYVDRDRYRDAYGVTAQWRRILDRGMQMTGYAQGTGLTYPGQEIRNANRYTLGLTVAKALGGRFSPTLTVGAYGGVEDERADNVDHLGHRFFGVSLYGQLQILPDVSAFAGLGAENRDYGGTDPFFLVRREDAVYSVRGGLSYAFAPDWSLSPQVSYTRNDSTVALNDYDRLVLSLTLRRDFR